MNIHESKDVRDFFFLIFKLMNVNIFIKTKNKQFTLNLNYNFNEKYVKALSLIKFTYVCIVLNFFFIINLFFLFLLK